MIKKFIKIPESNINIEKKESPRKIWVKPVDFYIMEHKDKIEKLFITANDKELKELLIYKWNNLISEKEKSKYIDKFKKFVEELK